MSQNKMGQQTLRSDSVGTGGNWILSVADVAPSASVALTLGLLVATAGLSSPLVIITVGVAMFLVATGFSHLNQWRPATGAPFLWIMDAVSPAIGLIMGLVMIIANLFSNIASITLAGTYLLSIVAPNHTFPWWIVWLISAALMSILATVAIVGLRLSVRMQLSLILFEFTTVLTFATLAIIHELTSHQAGVTGPSLTAFSVAGSPAGVHGLLLAVVPTALLFAGWEAPFSLGEESKARHVSTGVAARIGVVFVTVLFVVLILSFQGVAPQHDIIAHGSDVLTFAGSAIVGTGWGRILSVAVLVSILGAVQVLLIVGSRLVVAAARVSLLPGRLGTISAKFRTPQVAIVTLAIIPLLVLIPYLVNTTASTRVSEIVSVGGLLFLLVYFAVAATSTWFGAKIRGQAIRPEGTRSPRYRFSALLASILGGLFMIAAFFYALSTQAVFVKVSLVVVIAVCVIGGLIAHIGRQRSTRTKVDRGTGVH